MNTNFTKKKKKSIRYKYLCIYLFILFIYLLLSCIQKRISGFFFSFFLTRMQDIFKKLVALNTMAQKGVKFQTITLCPSTRYDVRVQICMVLASFICLFLDLKKLNLLSPRMINYFYLNSFFYAFQIVFSSVNRLFS